MVITYTIYVHHRLHCVRINPVRAFGMHALNAFLSYSDHISTEGGHAQHVLVTRTSNKMDDSSTDKQIFEFSKCPGPVEFRAAIYIVKCFRLKGIAEHVDHSTASL